MVQTHKTYGLLIALAMIIISVLLYVTDLTFKNQWMGMIGFIPYIIGVILNAQAYSKANDHHVTFGQVFSSSFKACAITTIVVIAWTLLSAYLIFPEMIDKMMEQSAEQMYANPEMTEQQIETALDVSRRFMIPLMIGTIMFGYMFSGAIFSLIGAAVAKKDPKPQIPQ